MGPQVGGEEMLDKPWPPGGSGRWVPVQGGSMRPALCEGDEVLLERVAQPLARGQVVVVRDARRRFVLHRVIAVRRGQVITRGDACLESDPAVPVQAVLLRAIRRRRSGAESPIPARRWPALRRLRWRLTRFLSLLARAPGRSSKETRSSSTSTAAR